VKVIIIIPTYNEAANIEGVLARLLAVGPEYEALVVDDASPDDTAALVGRLADREPRVHLLLRREERGFGTAVRDGFREALRRGAALVGQMDADGSHDPATLPALAAPILDEAADVVIGSRYAPGSRILGWGPWRYANSHVANALARHATGLPLADCTNGLRLFRREVLEALDLGGLRSRGYSMILETNYWAYRAGFRLREVPITFHPRAAGRSKLGVREIVRFGRIAWDLRWQMHGQPAGVTPPAPRCSRASGSLAEG
jgi:dolichol-phosphate mannosyltransferase